MERQEIVERTAAHAREVLEADTTGHDWWHTARVVRTAVYLAGQEGLATDLYVVQLAALLHDVADYKFHGGDDSAGPRHAREWLSGLGADETVISHVCAIIGDMSFKGAGAPSPMRTLEGKVVQDADRLDALGAIGIARTFAYGGKLGRTLYDPAIKPEMHDSFQSYKSGKSPSVNHFYEKLFLLKDLMNTDSARRLAEQRHQYMVEFIERFFQEWDGTDHD